MHRLLIPLWLLLVFSFDGYAAELSNTDTVAALIQRDMEAQPSNVRDIDARTPLGQLTLAQGVAQFYRARNYQPAWSDAATVQQLMREIEKMRDDGLDPEDYHLSQLRARFAPIETLHSQVNSNNDDLSKQRANFDVLATQAYLRSLAHLFRGKVNPKTLEPQWNFSRSDMSISEAMQIANDGIENHNLAAVYDHARPQHFLYQRARAALKHLRDIETAGGWPVFDATITLKPGMNDSHIAVLRQRLGIADTENADSYDAALVAAVKKFQREQYLEADGAVGAATRAALNISIQTRIDQLRVNLERGRWLLHDLQNDFVLVDVAGYKIYFLRQGERIWQSLVQVGRPARQTPVFKANITYITFNPTWTVPPTILRKDILPKLKSDSGYLDENHIRVLDQNGHQLDPKTIDWNKPGNVILRQDAGEDAALGQVAIRFPNPYSVYLHDTPHRELFENSRRAFSSGCIRVERPLELVELLFNDPQKWNRAAIEQLIAQGQTRNVNLPKPIPILLAYWTVDLFSDGDVGFKPDIYERDPDLLRALNARLSQK